MTNSPEDFNTIKTLKELLAGDQLWYLMSMAKEYQCARDILLEICDRVFGKKESNCGETVYDYDNMIGKLRLGDAGYIDYISLAAKKIQPHYQTITVNGVDRQVKFVTR